MILGNLYGCLANLCGYDGQWFGIIELKFIDLSVELINAVSLGLPVFHFVSLFNLEAAEHFAI